MKTEARLSEAVAACRAATVVYGEEKTAVRALDAVSLEIRKIYAVLPDSEASKHHLIRVVDESGEDYLYPAKFFMAVQLPQPLRSALRRTG